MGPAGGPTVWEYLVGAGGTAFVITFLTTRWMIRHLSGTRMVGRDIHKPGQPTVPEMGGLAVIAGFYAGVTVIQLYALDTQTVSYLHASMVAVFGAGFVGLLDDLFDLRQRTKAVLPFLFAIPLATVAFRDPFGTYFLTINVGVLVLLAIPFGITAAANAANMLEGFNGLGAGLGIIMCGAMIVLSFISPTHDFAGLYIIVPLLGALAGFLYFNRYPARIFPGDSMTLFTGAALAAAAIISHQKTYGAILFLPFIAEFILKARGRFRGENYGTLNGDFGLTYEGPTESLSHALMKWRRLTESQIVVILWGFEAVVSAAVILAALAGL